MRTRGRADHPMTASAPVLCTVALGSPALRRLPVARTSIAATTPSAAQEAHSASPRGAAANRRAPRLGAVMPATAHIRPATPAYLPRRCGGDTPARYAALTGEYTISPAVQITTLVTRTATPAADGMMPNPSPCSRIPHIMTGTAGRRCVIDVTGSSVSTMSAPLTVSKSPYTCVLRPSARTARANPEPDCRKTNAATSVAAQYSRRTGSRTATEYPQGELATVSRLRTPWGNASSAIVPKTHDVAASTTKSRKNDRVARAPAAAGPIEYPRLMARRYMAKAVTRSWCGVRSVSSAVDAGRYASEVAPASTAITAMSGSVRASPSPTI